MFHDPTTRRLIADAHTAELRRRAAAYAKRAERERDAKRAAHPAVHSAASARGPARLGVLRLRWLRAR